MQPVKNVHAKILAAASGVAASFPSAPALAQQGNNRGWPMGSGMMGGWGMGWFGGIFMIIFWLIILAAVVYFIKWLIQSTGRSQAGAVGGNRALEILKERYARGEIDSVEFEKMKSDLSK